jgi:hypothetical protein
MGWPPCLAVKVRLELNILADPAINAGAGMPGIGADDLLRTPFAF